MTYEFRTADGRICCSGDHFDCLCKSCKAQARSSSPGRSVSTAVPGRMGAPPPPDLAASIRAKRAAGRMTVAQRQQRARDLVLAQPRPMADGRLP